MNGDSGARTQGEQFDAVAWLRSVARKRDDRYQNVVADRDRLELAATEMEKARAEIARLNLVIDALKLQHKLKMAQVALERGVQ